MIRTGLLNLVLVVVAAMWGLQEGYNSGLKAAQGVSISSTAVPTISAMYKQDIRISTPNQIKPGMLLTQHDITGTPIQSLLALSPARFESGKCLLDAVPVNSEDVAPESVVYSSISCDTGLSPLDNSKVNGRYLTLAFNGTVYSPDQMYRLMQSLVRIP
jgi:hypothetical protein